MGDFSACRCIVGFFPLQYIDIQHLFSLAKEGSGFFDNSFRSLLGSGG